MGGRRGAVVFGATAGGPAVGWAARSGAAGAAAAGLALLWGVRRVAGGRSGTDRRPGGWLPEAGTGRGHGSSGARGRIPRLACWTAIPALLAGAAAGLLASLLVPGGPQRSWDVAACDVGQGDGVVVRTGERSAIVVDAGPETDLMGRCLDRLGVEQIDVLVLTHMHLDRSGGIDGVLAGRQTERVLYSSAKEALPEVVRAFAPGPWSGSRTRRTRSIRFVWSGRVDRALAGRGSASASPRTIPASLSKSSCEWTPGER